ncbi:MAG: hypothetical protein Q8Q25_00595 [bacterium]|nr:hypothetical protein [bacterium]
MANIIIAEFEYVSIGGFRIFHFDKNDPSFDSAPLSLSDCG